MIPLNTPNRCCQFERQDQQAVLPLLPRLMVGSAVHITQQQHHHHQQQQRPFLPCPRSHRESTPYTTRYKNNRGKIWLSFHSRVIFIRSRITGMITSYCATLDRYTTRFCSSQRDLALDKDHEATLAVACSCEDEERLRPTLIINLWGSSDHLGASPATWQSGTAAASEGRRPPLHR